MCKGAGACCSLNKCVSWPYLTTCSHCNKHNTAACLLHHQASDVDYPCLHLYHMCMHCWCTLLQDAHTLTVCTTPLQATRLCLRGTCSHGHRHCRSSSRARTCQAALPRHPLDSGSTTAGRCLYQQPAVCLHTATTDSSVTGCVHSIMGWSSAQHTHLTPYTCVMLPCCHACACRAAAACTRAGQKQVVPTGYCHRPHNPTHSGVQTLSRPAPSPRRSSCWHPAARRLYDPLGSQFG